MTEDVRHYQIGQKYKVRIEKAASTRGQDGFLIEVNGDNLDEVSGQAEAMYSWVKQVTATEALGFVQKKETKGGE